MNHSLIANKLFQNQNIYKDFLYGISKEEYLWRPGPEKWCLLEIVCHLYDEEQFDFRVRVKHVLENIQSAPPPIDPVGWVKSKNYIGQDYDEVLEKFLNERNKSVEWLKGLKNPDWKNEFMHPQFGAMSAEFFLTNWLAHDYLHFRQITAIKFKYLQETTGINLIYAGDW